jgi:hypothetical protein
MTEIGVSSIITAIASLISAVGSAAAVLMAIKNGRRIDEVHTATNGMKEELVKVTGEKKFAEGVKQGEDYPRKHR